jgi:two-component system OmpR family sensor kinase
MAATPLPSSENLDMSVSAGLEGHTDELAVLARDFDAMAARLRANRSTITQLLRDISHELRSPLARMRVAFGLARQTHADLPRQLDRMEREIERLDSLISQVLKLARLHGTDASFATARRTHPSRSRWCTRRAAWRF